ncbi:MAG TPA: M23 family metallopeptidase [Alphaproteobacteria bacterium]|nr:M23 family metallopeptidase [Alphaproteobacteria bacterium]USO06112.1 MAG: M23 family metallopeptidase [Rhodospirillales bacterium]HOO82055.1 M23 family metallopeptidase [Alphaproteobacteria bacterium]
MADKTEKRSILDDILAHVTVQSANGAISINSSSLGKGKSQTVKNLQQELSNEGLYVSKGHRYYNDGYPGGITDFGLLMKADPIQAINHINDALNDNNLNEKDILKLQIALNASTDDPTKKIKVLGEMNAQTANRLADHLAQQMIKPDPNSALSKALQKHAAPTKLSEIGIEAKKQTSDRFNNSAAHHNHDHGHGHGHGQNKEIQTRKPVGSNTLDTSTSPLTLRTPINNMRVTSTLKERFGKSHQGLDINTEKRGNANIGEPIHAPANGVVAYAGASSGYGKLISLYHGHNVYTQYGHVRDTNHLSIGQSVNTGENFAQIGKSGTNIAHLHFEVIIERNGVGYIVDPQKALVPGVNLYDPDVQNKLIESASEKISKNTSEAFGTRVASFNEQRYETTLIASNTINDKPAIT